MILRITFGSTAAKASLKMLTDYKVTHYREPSDGRNMVLLSSPGVPACRLPTLYEVMRPTGPLLIWDGPEALLTRTTLWGLPTCRLCVAGPRSISDGPYEPATRNHLPEIEFARADRWHAMSCGYGDYCIAFRFVEECIEVPGWPDVARARYPARSCFEKHDNDHVHRQSAAAGYDSVPPGACADTLGSPVAYS